MEPVDGFDVLYNALLIEDEDKRIQTLRTLIDSGVDVSSCWNGDSPMMMFESEGLTVLMVAARNGYVDCVQVLLEAGANVNLSDVEGQTALISAASNNYVECMNLLLEAGANVDQSNSNGATALTRAASNGSDKCVRLLIEANANVNHSVDIGGTALIKTAIFKCFECMKLLLEAGADVEGVDKKGNTALILCLDYFGNSDKSKACSKLIIDAGADIDVRNNSNLQPIHYALKWWKHSKFLAEYFISENCNLSQASYDTVKACCFHLKEEDRLDILNCCLLVDFLVTFVKLLLSNRRRPLDIG